MDYFTNIIQGLMSVDNVEAVTLGGSRATNLNDEKSDYDVYVYYSKPINTEIRKKLLARNCNYMEIAVNYFEEEDDCVLKNGIVIELIYRDFDSFSSGINHLYQNNEPSLGYTTCFFDNIMSSLVLFDRNKKYQEIKEMISIYPEQLRQKIIQKNMNLLHGVIASYDAQIIKAFERNDEVSVNHRITAYLASYFDIIFAVNKVYHPGEKRLIEIAKKRCKALPNNFEENINKLIKTEDLKNTLNSIYNELTKII